jgi:hypothetical protein
VEFEIVAGYGITPNFRVGIQGDFWWGLDNYKVAGTEIPDSKERFTRVGVNLGYTLFENLQVNLRYMQDVSSENFTKGSWTYLRLVYIF